MVKRSSLYLTIIGFLYFVFLVIVADVLGGAGYVDIYYAFAFLTLIFSVSIFKATKKTPFVFKIYFIVILLSQILSHTIHLWFLRHLVSMFVAVFLAYYISIDAKHRLGTYSKMLIAGIVLSSIYFFVFASGEFVADSTGEFRNALKYYSVSSAGLMACLCYFYGFSHFLFQKKFKYIVIALIGFLIAVYAISKNAIFSMVIVSAFWILIIYKGRLSKKIITLSVLGLIVFLILGDRLFEFFEEIEIDTGDSSPTGQFSVNGRGYIWAICVEMIAEKPFLGWGYYAAIEKLTMLADDTNTQAHNMILQSLISVGFVGTSVLVLYLFSIFRHIKSLYPIYRNNADFIWITCMFTLFLIRGLTEGSIAQSGTTDVFFFILFSLIIYFLYDKNRNIINYKL